MWSKGASLEWFGSAEPFTSKMSAQRQNCENVCVCVCTPVLALCSSSRYWAECVSSISSICSTFFLPRAARILDAFFRRNVFRVFVSEKDAYIRVSRAQTYRLVLPQLLLEEEHLGPYGVQAEVWGTLLRRPAQLEPGQRQVPAEPVVVLLPGGAQRFRSASPLNNGRSRGSAHPLPACFTLVHSRRSV